MKRKMMLVAACAALWSAAALAVPSFNDVQATVKSGDYPKAETMMQEVVAANPQKAKAHYLYAEILAKDAKFSDAAAQARQARELDPALSFTTDPEKFKSFERLLQREQAGPAAHAAGAGCADARERRRRPVRQQAPSSGIPGWVWVGGIAAAAVRRSSARCRGAPWPQHGGSRRHARQGGYGMQPGMQQPGYGPGYGQPGFGQAPGSGLLGTGLAAAGGVAAGMLVEKMIEGNRHDENYGGGCGGGTQGGSFDNGSSQAASELENRSIDFGNGNDWGGDAGAAARRAAATTAAAGKPRRGPRPRCFQRTGPRAPSFSCGAGVTSLRCRARP